MQVSTNGFFAFEETGIQQPLGNTIIAPLWADFNFRLEGNLFYRVANDNITLNAIVERISQRNSAYADYTPTEAVIVTWFQSTSFEIQSDFTVRI